MQLPVTLAAKCWNSAADCDISLRRPMTLTRRNQTECIATATAAAAIR